MNTKKIKLEVEKRLITRQAEIIENAFKILARREKNKSGTFASSNKGTQQIILL